MSTVKDAAHARRQVWLTPPFKLNLARTLLADQGGAEVGARQLRLRGDSSLDRVIKRDVQRIDGQREAVEVKSHRTPAGHNE
jgi:hypothetical protein